MIQPTHRSTHLSPWRNRIKCPNPCPPLIVQSTVSTTNVNFNETSSNRLCFNNTDTDNNHFSLHTYPKGFLRGDSVTLGRPRIGKASCSTGPSIKISVTRHDVGFLTRRLNSIVYERTIKEKGHVRRESQNLKRKHILNLKKNMIITI